MFISCETTVKPAINPENTDQPMTQQKDYKTSNNTANTLVLHYKVEEESTNPVRRFTYYVTDRSSGKVIRQSEVVAAEKIYWKDNTTLAVIPYKEVMQKYEVPGEPEVKNEILIYIKKQ